MHSNLTGEQHDPSEPPLEPYTMSPTPPPWSRTSEGNGGRTGHKESRIMEHN